MTVTNETNRIDLEGTGALTTFSFPFQIFDESELQVWVNTALLILTTDYTITSTVGDPAGGTVELLVAPGNGEAVTLLRVQPLTQETSYPSNDKFPAASHERALDKLTMLIQQLSEVDQRTLKLAVTSLYSFITLDDPDVGKFLRWRNNSAIEAVDIAELGSLGVPVSVADGGTGLTSVGAEGQVLTAINGALAYKSGPFWQLENQMGETSEQGRVAVADDSATSTAVLTTSVGDTRPVVICTDPGQAVGNQTFFRSTGVIGIQTTGVVTRGDFLRTSATAGRAESAGTTKVNGSFAVALSPSAGGLSAVNCILFGDTYEAAATPAYVDAAPRENLKIAYSTAHEVTVAADTIKMVNGSGVGRVKRSFSVTVDIEDVGLNGRDTSAAEAGSTWYWLWAVSDGVDDGCLLVPDTGGGAPDVPDTAEFAWTYKLFLGAVYNNSSGDIVSFRQDGDRYSWAGDSTNGPRIVFTAKAGVASYTAESIAAFIPNGAVASVQGTRGLSTGLADFAFAVAANSSGEHADLAHARGDGVTSKMNWLVAVPFDIPWVSGTNIYWRTGGTTAIYRLGIRGFTLAF